MNEALVLYSLNATYFDIGIKLDKRKKLALLDQTSPSVCSRTGQPAATESPAVFPTGLPETVILSSKLIAVDPQNVHELAQPFFKACQAGSQHQISLVFKKTSS